MIMSQELKLGPFKVDPQGMLSPATPTTFPRFSVRWRGRLLTTSMRQTSAEDAHSGMLDLTIRLGRLPSTTGLGGAQREAALGVVKLLPRLIPARWQWQLRADHSILLQAQLVIALPVSAVGLVAELTAFLIELDPYLQELDDSGLMQSALLH